MEEKKNNAVEKVEQVETSHAKPKSKKSHNKSSAKKSKTHAKKKNVKTNKSAEERKRLSAERKRKKLEKREAVKAEREKIRAEKRVELARLKAHKKAEKEKAKATALREKNRRIAEHKAKKEQIKAEKERRRDMLKNETKKQRAERIKEERARKAELKKARHEEKARLKREKLNAKKSAKSERRKNRQRNKDRNKGYGGWLAAVISLGVATLVLASVLTFTFMMPTVTDNMLEVSYQKSFYDTVEQVNNMDTNLSKALATADSGALQNYLVDVAINSELAENDIQQLPLQDESKHYTTKIINQIGDYAKYLNKKLINGEELTDTDISNLTQLYKANRAIRSSLKTMMDNMSNDYSFSSMMDGGEGNLVIENFNELQNLSVEYPELIYDGPFSDGLDRKEIKGLQGDTIDQNVAVERFNEIFGEYGVMDVMNVGMTENSIKCYNVQGMIGKDVLYAQISEKGGELIMFSYAGTCMDVVYDGDYATEKAMEFLNNLGIEEIKPVWINQSNNVYTINFASVQDDVIIYSDLIKVRVCAETAMVIGMEASGYYTNHTDRILAKPAIDKTTAQSKISTNIDVLTCRLSVVPIGQQSEKLCYEFSGEYDGSVYYVYIDAVTGRQVEMFKVINSTEGDLLM